MFYSWMAPESLVDGVFTCQSDVWAFGVLIWEIMTFGQQPYPARTNLEVLHYVRNGGRLGRPNNCPDELYVYFKIIQVIIITVILSNLHIITQKFSFKHWFQYLWLISAVTGIMLLSLKSQLFSAALKMCTVLHLYNSRSTKLTTSAMCVWKGL